MCIHAMASMCSSPFKTRTVAVKYPEGVLSDVNRFYLIRVSSFIRQADRISLESVE